MSKVSNDNKCIKLEEVSIGDLLSDNKIAIPPYQRPYKWSTNSCVTLYNDIYEAMSKDIDSEYRIGNVIIHKDGKNKYIVDGQQRLTTLSIILYAIEKIFLRDRKIRSYDRISNKLMECQYNNLSYSCIVENYNIINNILNEEKDKERISKLYGFIINQCKVLQIITYNQSEAFQFFDSQNSRGKPLYPHDILKAYHLRIISQELDDSKNNERKKIVEKWESIKVDKQNDNYLSLDSLFSNYLFPIIKWCKKENGLYFDTDNIDTFKGINLSNYKSEYEKYGYVKYEKSKYSVNDEFQITGTIKAGMDFFKYVDCYYNKIQKIKKILDKELNDESYLYKSGQGAGFTYVKRLFECACLLVCDRFNEETLKDNLNKLYKWAYALKLGMKSVYKESINKYALGDHQVSCITNDNKNLFNYIINSIDVKGLRDIVITYLKDVNYEGSIDDNILKTLLSREKNG